MKTDKKSVQGQNEGSSARNEAGVNNWYAVYTIVRHEKTVNRLLEERDMKTFLPLKRVVSQWKDRRKEIQIPLFPGYMFVSLNEGDSLGIFQVLSTRGVVRMLSANGKLLLVDVKQINAIQSLIASKMQYDPYPYLVKGRDVIVTKGPLRGLSGKVVDRRGDNRLIISIDIIRRSVAVSVNPSDVELL